MVKPAYDSSKSHVLYQYESDTKTGFFLWLPNDQSIEVAQSKMPVKAIVDDKKIKVFENKCSDAELKQFLQLVREFLSQKSTNFGLF